MLKSEQPSEALYLAKSAPAGGVSLYLDKPSADLVNGFNYPAPVRSSNSFLAAARSSATITRYGFPVWAWLLVTLAAVSAAAYFFIPKKSRRRRRR